MQRILKGPQQCLPRENGWAVTEICSPTVFRVCVGSAVVHDSTLDGAVMSTPLFPYLALYNDFKVVTDSAETVTTLKYFVDCPLPFFPSLSMFPSNPPIFVCKNNAWCITMYNFWGNYTAAVSHCHGLPRIILPAALEEKHEIIRQRVRHINLPRYVWNFSPEVQVYFYCATWVPATWKYEPNAIPAELRIVLYSVLLCAQRHIVLLPPEVWWYIFEILFSSYSVRKG